MKESKKKKGYTLNAIEHPNDRNMDGKMDLFNLMEEHAQSKAEERKWSVDEIIEKLESFKNIEAAPAWFNTYGR